jgi:hypothetical protein
MKWLIWILCIGVIAFAQTFERGQIDIVRHVDGHITIETAELLIQADAADGKPETREFTLRGNVTVKMKQAPSR